MEPDNLLPSQLLIHGRELFVSKSLCVLARFPFLLSLRRWLCQLYRHRADGNATALNLCFRAYEFGDLERLLECLV